MHKMLIERQLRPFSTVDEMNRVLIDNITDTLSAGDQLYILGDLAMGLKTESLPLLKGISNEMYLVPGNHDRVAPWDKHADRWREAYEEVGLQILPAQVELELSDGFVYILNHFPYQGDHTDEDRYLDFRPVDRGGRLLHGHLHGAMGRRTSGRSVDVGVDAWGFRPVSEDLIVSTFVTSG